MLLPVFYPHHSIPPCCRSFAPLHQMFINVPWMAVEVIFVRMDSCFDFFAGFNASSEDLALQSAEWHMVAVGEDLTCVRTRAKKAFRKMVLTYQKEIDRHKQRATALEEVLRAQQLGGSEYTRLLIERDELAQEFDDLSKKLIDVQKELVDAQERQKDCEAELEQMKV